MTAEHTAVLASLPSSLQPTRKKVPVAPGAEQAARRKVIRAFVPR